MSKFALFVLSLSIFLLSGCSTSHSSLPGPTSTPTSVAKTNILSPTPPGSLAVKEYCLEIEDVLPGEAPVGTIVALDMISHEIYLLSMGEEEQVSLQERWPFNFSISPNGKWLAYIHRGPGDERMLVVLDRNGLRYQQVLPLNLRTIWQWVDDRQILFVEPAAQGSEAFILTLLDPFTGEYQIREDIYPGILDIYQPALDWFYNLPYYLAYDFSITTVLYPRFYHERPGIVLWDTQQQREITLLEVPNYGKVPKWSPDGTRVSIVAATRLNYDDFLIIDKDGHSSRLTYLADHYAPVLIHDYAWSPQGDYIAFWMSRNAAYPFRDLQLGLLDTHTGQVVNYCGVENSTNYEPPVWISETQFLISTTDTSYGNQLVLVDIRQDRAFRIAMNVLPLGWLVP